MSSTASTPGPGGFLHPTLPSPPPSSDVSGTNTRALLPRPRATPLRPGSQKYSVLIDYIDKKLLAISRRYEKRFNVGWENKGAEDEEAWGYDDFAEMAKELGAVVDLIWVSGTPSLQTPYLLTIALTVCSSIPSFPFSPSRTFDLLRKLDTAFYSLLRCLDEETGEQLPGFGNGRAKLSTTEKVRMRGLVEKTRIAVVEVAGKGQDATGTEHSAQTDNDITTDDEDDATVDGMQIDGYHGRWEMEVARVYERTIVELGTSLDPSGTDGLG